MCVSNCQIRVNTGGLAQNVNFDFRVKTVKVG